MVRMEQSDLVEQHQLRRLYQMSVTGVYNDDLLADVLAQLHYILSNMASTVNSDKLLALLTLAKTDAAKMIAIDAVIHEAHTSGFYAQHLIKGKDKVEVMNFLSEIAGISRNAEYIDLMTHLINGGTATVPQHALYGTIDLTGFEELNKTAIRDTRKRFAAMGIQEYTFTNKTLLDIGCNVGHMLFEATICGFPSSYGFEHVPRIAAAGRKIAKYLRVTDTVNIQQADANSLSSDTLGELTGHRAFDVVFCFALDGYIRDPQAFYGMLSVITKETLYFEPNNHKIDWDADRIKSWGFKSVEKVTVPYDKNTGSTRNCFICYK